MNAEAKHVTSLDAGISPQFHIECDWRGASEFRRQAASHPMKILWITLLVLSPAILYVCALLFVAVYRGRCPRCQRHGLRRVGGYLWDGRTEQGLTGDSDDGKSLSPSDNAGSRPVISLIILSVLSDCGLRAGFVESVIGHALKNTAYVFRR